MGLDEFKLCVDNKYFSGRTLSGFVQIICGTDLTNINHIQVKVVGFANVKWNEREKRYHGPRYRKRSYYTTVTYENHNDLFCFKSIIHRGDISEGQHEIPFEFEIPMDLPCSFEGQYGHIRYYVEAKLDRSGIFTSHKRQRKYITVLSLVDLNKIPGSDQPINVFREKEFANDCCCIDGGYVNVKLNLSRSCFTPGEYFPVTAEIENHSDRTINRTSAELIMDVRYYESTEKSANKCCVVLARSGDKIEGGKSASWSELPLCSESVQSGCCTSTSKWIDTSPIPPLPPSTIERYNHCDIIKCSYRLEFAVFVRSYPRPFIIINVPLTIGSIPLRRMIRNCVQSKPENIPRELEPSAPPPPTIDGNDDLPPPSYAEAVTMDQVESKIIPRPCDTKDTHANWNFKPQYPVWNLNTT